MMHTVLLLSILARCAAFGTVSGRPAGCVDIADHLIAAETAKAGAPYNTFTSCDGIAEAGGCGRADAKYACCATCSDPVKSSYTMPLTQLQWSEVMYPCMWAPDQRAWWNMCQPANDPWANPQ